VLVGRGASIVFAIEAFEVSARPLETIADALTAIGQLSIIEECVGRSGVALIKSLSTSWVFGLVCCVFLFAQQSCELEAHECSATTVSTESIWADEEACVSLLQPNRQPAPAIQSETLIANDKSRIFVMGSRFI
jgi:hypothetical protein